VSEQDLRDWGQQQQAVGRCAHCPDWTVLGTAEEVRELFEAHRVEAHSDIPYKKRSRRQRANPSIIAYRQSLTDDESKEIDEIRRRRMYQLGQTGE